MLIKSFDEIGEALYAIRKGKGLTQAQVAEKAELSDRTYADIERGSVNMRLETLLKICEALNITPNDILTKDEIDAFHSDELLSCLKNCTEKERKTALQLLSVYLKSLN